MSSIVNRAPYVVTPSRKANADKTAKFRSRKAAEAYQKELAEAQIPATIRQSSVGSWEAVVRRNDGNGDLHEKRQRFDTEEEAKQWAQKEEEKVLASRPLRQSLYAGKIRFEDAANEWYEHHGASLKGWKIVLCNLPAVVERIKPDTLLGDINVRLVRAFRDGMQKDGYAPSTIGNHRQILSGTLKYFISEKDLPGPNPCSSVKWPRPKNAERPTLLSEKDEAKLINTIDSKRPWLTPIVSWALKTAMRRGEINAMDWSHVSDFNDPARARLLIPNTKHDWKNPITTPKGREVPLWPELISLLEKTQPDPSKRQGKVFPGTLNSISHAFQAATKETDFEDLKFHSLRKIATAKLSKKLPNAIELAAVTGHKDIRVLAERYYGVSLETLMQKLSGEPSKTTRTDLLLEISKIIESGDSDAIDAIKSIITKLET